MASVVVVAGVGVAGQQSLPGEPFYGVKRAVEGAQLRTADGALARGTTHLDHASERLDEVAALTRGRDAVALAPVGSRPVAAAATADLVVETLDDMDTSVRAAARLLTRASDAGADPAPLQQLTGFAVRQDRELSALLPVLPLAAQERAQASLALSDEVGDSAVALLLDALPAPGAASSPVAEGAVGSVPADPAQPGVPAAPGAPLAPAAPGAPPAASAAPSGEPAPGSTGSPDGGATAPGTGSEPAPDAEPQPTTTSRPTSRPGVPVPAPVQTVPVPLPVPVPVPTSIPLPVPVPDLPALPVPPVPPVVVDAPGLPSLPKAPALPAAPAPVSVDDVVPAPLKPVTRPLLPGLLVAAPETVPSPLPGAAPVAPGEV